MSSAQSLNSADPQQNVEEEEKETRVATPIPTPAAAGPSSMTNVFDETIDDNKRTEGCGSDDNGDETEAGALGGGGGIDMAMSVLLNQARLSQQRLRKSLLETLALAESFEAIFSSHNLVEWRGDYQGMKKTAPNPNQGEAGSNYNNGKPEDEDEVSPEISSSGSEEALP